MNRFKHWFYEKHLPLWCKEQLTVENAQLQAKVDSQRHEIERLNMYINGMHTALKYSGRIARKRGGAIEQ